MPQNLAYIDCFSGISGDMTLGALIDLGTPIEFLQTKLSQMPLQGFTIKVETESRMGIHGKRLHIDVTADETSRDYTVIRSLIENSPFSDRVKKQSLSCFEKLAQAESEVHCRDKHHVHFHEVGGIDAIVDIVGTALSMEYLEIDKCIASKIPLGSGFVTCAHGILPVPAPATALILQGVPVYGSDIEQELVTPTGAAIIKTVAEKFENIPPMIINRIGYGVGSYKLKNRPNLLRILIGQDQSYLEHDKITVIETNIDNMNPELYGFLIERLFSEGALDVILIPVFMKKNRPGTLVQVLCNPYDREKLSHIIFSETTTNGLRFHESSRTILQRESIVCETPFGKIDAKKAMISENNFRIVPEYESCKKIAMEKKIPILQVYKTLERSI